MSRLALLLLPATLLLAACGDDRVPAPPEQPVRVVTVGMGATGDRVTASGLVRAREELTLAFKTGGVIRELDVEAGQVVRAGQVLAALEMPELDAQVTQAEEALAKAGRDLARASSLRARGLVALQAEQDAQTQHEVAAAALSAARFNREHAVISAPAGGVVLQKRAEARETVAPGQPVLVVGRADRGWVLRAGLSDRDAVRVRPGDAASVTLDAWPEQRLAGRVRTVAAASDPRTGTVEVEVALPPSGLRLVSGLVGRVTLEPAAGAVRRNVPTLPLGALLEGNAGRAHVFVLAADRRHVRRRVVQTGALAGDHIQVLAGLAAGEQVVSEGAAWLNDGDAVRLLP